MPINIIIGLVSLLVALVLYTMGAFGALRRKGFERRQVTYLWVGFVFDVLATVMMALQIGGLDLAPLSHLVHTVLALVAMFGMFAIALVAWRALADGRSRTSATPAKLALAPWALWVFVFVWGMVSRGSARMG